MGATSQGVDGPRDGTGDTGRDSLEELLVRVRSMGMGAAATPAIGTKGVFPLMELPSELRLQIYQYLLIVPEPINIETLDNTYYTLSSPSQHPSVAILQTCKEINEEGIPILYSQNKFIVCLSITLNNFIAIEPGPSSTLANSLFLRGLRWSTISQLSSVSFISSSTFTPGDDGVQRLSRPRPSFVCTGADILARFQAPELVFSPWGPDDSMALSISNWVSMQVMREELNAFQRALQAMMSEEAGVNLYDDNPVI